MEGHFPASRCQMCDLALHYGIRAAAASLSFKDMGRKGGGGNVNAQRRRYGYDDTEDKEEMGK